MRLMVEEKGDTSMSTDDALSKARPKAKGRKLLIVIAIVVIVVCMLSGAALLALTQLQKKPPIDIGSGAKVTQQLEILPEDKLKQIAAVYVFDVAKDMDWAYAKALALSQLDRHQESLDVYEAIHKTGKAPYYIYEDYALTAGRVGDRTLAVSMMTKAVESLDTDSSIDAAAKEPIKKRLSSKLDGFKEAREQ